MGTMKAANMKKAYQQLDTGMKKESVLQLLGEPNSKRMRDGVETYSWWNREFKGLIRGGSIERRITVEFENGVVIGYDGENIDASIL